MPCLLIPSPLGDLIAVADETHLLMLEFADQEGLEERLSVLTGSGAFRKKELESSVSPGSPRFTRDDGNHPILRQTELELSEYFSGKRRDFSIPLAPEGTEFQKKAWQALTAIPYGETRSYKEEAILAGSPRAVRAIGGANNKNPIVIVIPCHRVVGADGSLTGYAGGLERKKWLLKHEKQGAN